MPDECVITKENRINFLTDRLTPPDLSEISTARIVTGLLSAEQIVTGSDQHDCPVLVYNSSFDEQMPELADLAREQYALQLNIKEPNKSYEIDLYATQIDTLRPPPYPIERTLGDIQLRGFDVTPSPWRAGQTVSLSLYWQALADVDRDYKTFLHLTDAAGNVLQGFDRYPFQMSQNYLINEAALHPDYLANNPGYDLSSYPSKGLLPTGLWLPGDTLKETIPLELAADLPAGDYTLLVGMYDEATLERLPINDGLPGSDFNHIVLTPIQVVPSLQ